MRSHRLTVAAAALAAVVVSLLPFAPSLAFRTPQDGLEGLEESELPLQLKFNQVEAGKIYDAIGAAAGIEFHVHEDLVKKPATIQQPMTTLKQALTAMGFAVGATYHVLDPATVEVLPILLVGANGVENPVLVAGPRAEPVYPEDAREQGLEGWVILQAVIDRNGTVGAVEPLRVEPPDYQPFLDSAVAAVLQWHYHPATQDGKPVDVYFTIKVTFRLE